jgi:hypothetical protein
MGHKTSTRQVIRQRSSVWLAAMSAVTGLLLLVSLVRNWASYPRLSFAAWVLFGLAVAWAVFVRPAVLLDASGVTLRNIVRDVHIPWTRLTSVTSRWNLKVLVGDQGYNAWAISAQVERRKSSSAAMLRVPLPGRLHGAASGGAGPSVTAPQATAASVALLITAAKQEYDESVVQGELPAAPDARVRVTWVPLVIAVVLLPAVLVVVLSLT